MSAPLSPRDEGSAETLRPRRSVLYVPGSNPKALAKARTLPCDGVILDLEDSVAPEAKEPARRAVVEAAAAGGFAPRELLVRVNARGTPWHRDDLAALARLAVDGIVLPKVEWPEDVREAAGVLAASGAPAAQALWLTIETPRGILAADLLASAHPSVAGLVAGTSDLTKELRARHVPGREPLLHALSAIVLAARAHSLAALDGVHLALEDEEGFAAACRQGRDLGFDGKTLIHPRTIPAANRAFAPDPAEVDDARRLLATWSAARAEGRGVVVHERRLVEELHAREAERLVALAEAIAARGSEG
ncbi:MAG: HpcH/HpaI aldolase/citrate lyase family protein [Thermoanaerobaculia bacterium]